MPARPIEGIVKHYTWGSDRAIAELLGRPASGSPEAELWFGAHPAGPARLLGVPADSPESDLLEWFRTDPQSVVGERVLSRLGNQFPFLLKVLAAETPLSLQAHPSLEQARAGFLAEQALGLPPESSSANYKDANHKPELILALQRFSLLTGFSPWELSRERVSLLGLDSWLAEPLSAFARTREDGGTESEARETFFRALFLLPEHKRLTMSERIGENAARLVAESALGSVLERLAETYPADPGLFVVLLMNYLELAPGEALFMPARRLHAYLEGLGLEVMASSDNVLRGGLTSKRVDVAELCRILDFSDQSPAILLGREDSSDDLERRSYDAPVQEFLLSTLRMGTKASFTCSGPAIALVLDGLLQVSDSSIQPLLRERGEACFIPASEGVVSLSGPGRVALVSLPASAAER